MFVFPKKQGKVAKPNPMDKAGVVFPKQINCQKQEPDGRLDAIFIACVFFTLFHDFRDNVQGRKDQGIGKRCAELRQGAPNAEADGKAFSAVPF